MRNLKGKFPKILISMLMISMLIMGTQSCSDEDDIQGVKTSTQEEYVNYSQNVSDALGSVLSGLGVPQTRGTVTGLNKETVSYLLSLTPDELDAWYDEVTAIYGEEFYEKYYDYDKVRSVFSDTQIVKFKEFLDTYLNSGISDNQKMIESYVAKLDHKERQLYVLGAVYVDSIVRPLLNGMSTVQARGMSHCELELAARILEDTAESVVMDIALDGMDNPVIDIYCTAGDVEAVLGAVHDYHRCRAGL